MVNGREGKADGAESGAPGDEGRECGEIKGGGAAGIKIGNCGRRRERRERGRDRRNCQGEEERQRGEKGEREAML